MPTYTVSYTLVDDFNRTTTKTFETVDLVDEAAALAAAAGLATDLSNLSEMGILSYTVSRRVVYSDTVDSGANKDEGLTLTLRKEDNYKAPVRVPAPIKSIFDAVGNADVGAAAVSAFVSNFLASGGEFTFSDGEQATAVLSGVLDK